MLPLQSTFEKRISNGIFYVLEAETFVVTFDLPSSSNHHYVQVLAIKYLNKLPQNLVLSRIKPTPCIRITNHQTNHKHELT